MRKLKLSAAAGCGRGAARAAGAAGCGSGQHAPFTPAKARRAGSAATPSGRDACRRAEGAATAIWATACIVEKEGKTARRLKVPQGRVGGDGNGLISVCPASPPCSKAPTSKAPRLTAPRVDAGGPRTWRLCRGCSARGPSSCTGELASFAPSPPRSLAPASSAGCSRPAAGLRSLHAAPRDFAPHQACAQGDAELGGEQGLLVHRGASRAIFFTPLPGARTLEAPVQPAEALGPPLSRRAASA